MGPEPRKDTPMKKRCTLSVRKMEELMGSDFLTNALRKKVREMILTLVDAELTEVLAALPYEHTGNRNGYRNGSKHRNLTTDLGKTSIDIPRARVVTDYGEKEWESTLVKRYQKWAASVDGALLGEPTRDKPSFFTHISTQPNTLLRSVICLCPFTLFSLYSKGLKISNLFIYHTLSYPALRRFHISRRTFFSILNIQIV